MRRTRARAYASLETGRRDVRILVLDDEEAAALLRDCLLELNRRRKETGGKPVKYTIEQRIGERG